MGEALLGRAASRSFDMSLETPREMLLKGITASGAILLATACGPSGGSPNGTGTSSPPANTTASPSPVLSFCQDVAGLRTALQTLTPIHGNSLPTSHELKAVAQDIQSSLSGLGRRTEWQTQIDNLRSATANMQSAADSLAASPGARGVSSRVTTAVASVNDSIRRLLTAVGSRCPSPSATQVPAS